LNELGGVVVLFLLCPDYSATSNQSLKTKGWANKVLNAFRAHHQLVDVRKHHGSTIDGIVVQAARAHEAFAIVAFFVFVILIGANNLFAKKTRIALECFL